MTIEFTKSLPKESGYDYKKGDVIEDAASVFGPVQAKYFLETGHAKAVGAKVESNVAPPTETPEK